MVIHLHFPFIIHYPALTTLLSSRCSGFLSGLALGYWQGPKEMLLEKQHSFLFIDSCLAGKCAQHPEWKGK